MRIEMKILNIVFLLILLVLCISCIKIVKIGEEDNLTGEIRFDAVENVISVWESKALPELTEKAVDLSVLLEEAKNDLKSVVDKYGKYSMGTSGEINYVVKAAARVTEVNNKIKAGFITILPVGYTGDTVIKLQIGSVFKGSSVRDSLDFIDYDDYKNQVEWASVSQSIHQVIQSKLIDSIDIDSVLGKEIDFVGCFTVQNNGEIIITPVVMQVK